MQACKALINRMMQIKKEGAPNVGGVPSLCFLSYDDGLLTQAKSLDDGAITVDVALIQIVEQCTTLTYQCGKSAGSSEIFVVLLQVLSKVRNTITEQCNLAFSRTSVLAVSTILTKDFFFFSGIQIHDDKLINGL